MTKTSQPWHSVRQSTLHGNGVFAARDIPAGTRIIDYGGRRITSEQADAMHPVNPDDPFHTFFFSLSSGKIIDGGNRGTDARWINHSCAPNCETQENDAGTRVHIIALRDIQAGEELFYDYGLIMDGKITKKLQKEYQCLCGNPECRGTMLALPKKKAKAAGGKNKDKKKAKPSDEKKSGKSLDKKPKKQDKDKAEVKAKSKFKKKSKDKAESKAKDTSHSGKKGS